KKRLLIRSDLYSSTQHQVSLLCALRLLVLSIFQDLIPPPHSPCV
ncbi:hypothetical protein EMGBS3_16450, partial [Anaerolineaceae bacterium]